uniref:Dynein light intermediate chain n=2 Tax=Macrostomum lignano TaxID=282301 RepID=A0A1I8FV24_9PLAT
MLGQVTRCRDQPEPDVRPHVCADDPGKTYLAQKLADYIVKREGAPSSAVTMFVVDHKSEKELRSYLNGIADEKSGNEVPLVIILDNLHHVNPLSEVLNSYLNSKSPYIIGTMNQAGCSSERLHAAKLQLHNTCNFRWVLCANHMEPVKGFLGRFLRRKLLNSEVMDRAYKPEAARIVDWIPSVWQHLNKFLETHSSSEVTIGPRQFLSCPVGTEQSQLWFADLWNHSLVPYLLEACREGLQTYGRRAPWEDPTEWIMATWPWEFSPAVDLIRLRPEDVGYETHPALSVASPLRQQQPAVATTASANEDPLLSMLLRLQAAANFGADTAADSEFMREPAE